VGRFRSLSQIGKRISDGLFEMLVTDSNDRWQDVQRWRPKSKTEQTMGKNLAVCHLSVNRIGSVHGIRIIRKSSFALFLTAYMTESAFSNNSETGN
jgi:hypothetical protein